ncbi:pyridoxamine 5'-phosphate oxidase-like FMN-binding protein [Natrialba magadii ATCC 43099]|uniref:Pyridoxamine 5'-phosphate oxidase-like FMN-binding protein n=1 Tax=Natrialba magadii (strain ATCC 43099 / DSM 3394 / CCM 3739 / CIP 104546 / IAM 13178 / JCM 8861 / NBRC 102185 / NCIMB 2190 / MS3) TaxID=547559 RepID=L9UJ93_NATMM|nr:pyridoxamine 5'-phosphate oxidase-like FMN-binding protein [Natrialba magadii ATCC 43099]
MGYRVVSTVSAETAELLESEPLMAHLGTCVDERPHVAPVWYSYDESAEVVEVVTSGKKLANIRENPRVALSIQADEGGQTQWTVSLLGTATIVEDEAANEDARRRIHAKYDAPADAYADNTLVRIDVGSATSQTY